MIDWLHLIKFAFFIRCCGPEVQTLELSALLESLRISFTVEQSGDYSSTEKTQPPLEASSDTFPSPKSPSTSRYIILSAGQQMFFVKNLLMI